MAMTKKERAEFDAAVLKAKTIGALRWTSLVKKDLPTPNGFGGFIAGWDFNSYNGTVRQMWSEAVVHGDGPKRERNGSASQNGRSLFSTKLLALRACRNAIEAESADKLRRIDDLIEAEEAANGA